MRPLWLELLRSDLIPEAHMVSPEWREGRGPPPPALPPLVQLRTTMLAEQYALLSAQAKRLGAPLNPLLIPTPDVQRLVWVPGIGRIVAFTIVLEIDGIDRFPSARDFVSY